ncbi:MAG: hypothetical protein JXX14_23675 [Deltaproteobacteria bacterium]|nr:hypothetical protein [Deltaproteobacteria bacterium]
MTLLSRDTMLSLSASWRRPGWGCAWGLILWGLIASCGSPAEDDKARRRTDGTPDSAPKKSFLSDESPSPDTLQNKPQTHEFTDDFFVLSVGAEMFDSLPLDQKSSLYKTFRHRYAHRNCAAAKQQYCQVRHILEQIMLHPSGVSVGIREKIKRYLKYLWLFGGNQHPVTHAPLRPTFIPGELGAATQIALKNGAGIDLSAVANAPLEANNIEQLETLLTNIRPYIFGPGVSGCDKQNDSACDSVADGAPPVEAVATAQSAPVFFEDSNFALMLDKLRGRADYCDQKVREVGGTKSTAARRPEIPFVAGHILDLPDGQSPLVQTASDILALGMVSEASVGDAATATRILWLNVNEAFESRFGQRVAEAFSLNRDVYRDRIAHRQLVSVAYHGLRNLVGYGADGTENKAADWLLNRLGENHVLLAELRADLAALYLAYDEEVQKTGLVPNVKTRDALLAEYLFSVVEQIGAGGDVGQDMSLKTRLMVLNFLTDAGVVSARATRPGYYEISIADYDALKNPLIQLLGKVRNVRFFGDPVKAAALVDELGHMPPGWQKGMVAQFNSLGVPRAMALVLPVIEKSPGTNGSASPLISIRTPNRFFDRNIDVASFAVR